MTIAKLPSISTRSVPSFPKTWFDLVVRATLRGRGERKALNNPTAISSNISLIKKPTYQLAMDNKNYSSNQMSVFESTQSSLTNSDNAIEALTTRSKKSSLSQSSNSSSDLSEVGGSGESVIWQTGQVLRFGSDYSLQQKTSDKKTKFSTLTNLQSNDHQSVKFSLDPNSQSSAKIGLPTTAQSVNHSDALKKTAQAKELRLAPAGDLPAVGVISAKNLDEYVQSADRLAHHQGSRNSKTSDQFDNRPVQSEGEVINQSIQQLGQFESIKINQSEKLNGTLSAHSKSNLISQSEFPTQEEVVEFIPTRATLAIASRRKAQWQKYQQKHAGRGKIGLRTLMRWSMFGIMVWSLITMSSILLPEIYFRLNPETINQVSNLSAEEIKEQHRGDESIDIEPNSLEEIIHPEPEFDASLPLGNWIRIPSIGVDTQLDPSANPDEALAKGAWLVPDFGRPNDTSLPVIAAAHRFGWDWWWLSDFGKKNSFYSLPKLQAGDEVQIVFNQRLYRYQVYAVQEGYEITDYNAHLILYTCKYLNSPDRYFVYADRMVEDVVVGENSSSVLSGDLVAR